MAKQTISIQKLNNGEVSEWLRFAYFASPSRFKETFKQNGILVESESDLIHLELASKNKPILSICKSVQVAEIDLKTNITLV